METLIFRLNKLGDSLDGELKHDLITRTIYSTDASVYKEMPVAANNHGMDGMRYGVMYVDTYSHNGGIFA